LLLPLLPNHLADLRKSGLSDAQIAACGFYSEGDPERVQKLLNWKRPAESIGPCLVIPYHAPDGAPTGFARLKPDKPRADKKKGGKSIKYEQPVRASNRAYVPPGTRAALTDPAVPLLITEGEKKGAAADQHGFACLALSGVWSWQSKRAKDDQGRTAGPRKMIPDLAAVVWKGRRVVVAFDSDLDGNTDVQWAEWHLTEALRQAGADVRAIRLPGAESGEKVGLDDYLLTHTAEELRALIDAAIPPTKPHAHNDRPTIVIDTEEFRVNAEAVNALARDPDLYVRGGMLVHIVEAQTDDDSTVLRRPDPTPVIRDLPNPLLRERLTKCAKWLQWRGSGEKAKLVPAHPPEWCVAALGARRDWPNLRQLEAVVPHPVMLPDGAILAANGYDSRSRLLVCLPRELALTVPDLPTCADVEAAATALADVVSDFPFQSPEHRAAWLAGLLTPLAWFAFSGPAPLFLIDANIRAAGKGLLADTVALMVLGRRFPVMAYTQDRDELRKRITTLAVEGDRMVLLDNLAGAVGNDVLDAALTSDRWKDRLLGGNRVYEGPLHVSWFATGNNVQLHADTARRVCHIRLETSDERPEMKTGFKYPSLRPHIQTNRGSLLSAALTILRGWVVAGRPSCGLKPWGSFEGWSSVVRDALVFAGVPDPGETRLALQSGADCDADAMTALLEAMEQMDPNGNGVTTGEIIDSIRKPSDPAPVWLADLRSAVEELCGKVDSRALGYRFRQFVKRNFKGRMIDRAGVDRCRGIRWVVRTLSGLAEGSKLSPASPASPVGACPVAGDAGDAGDVPGRNGKPRRRYTNDDRPFQQKGDRW
jgi:hypothetical protein